jgi:phospholipid/cholesterol/gamma-HCH transport system ATP-binding protein
MSNIPAVAPTGPASEDLVIDIRGLRNEIAGTVLHRDLDFAVRRDEVMTLVGGSGSGKTQLLRVIIGLKAPAAGSVRVLGVSLSGDGLMQVRAARQRMGMLFQNGALYSAFNVFDNIAFPLRERGGLDEETIRAVVYAKLEQVELEPQHAKLLPANLSGGMVKRVALARALALSPDLLILDEPTAGLDPDRSESFVRLIKMLRAQHRFAVLMVTHDLDTLYDLSDRIAVLADQHIIACGPLDEVRRLQHRFVQNFFGGDRALRCFDGAAIV